MPSFTPTIGEAIVAQLDAIYRCSIQTLRDAMQDYARDGAVPGPEARIDRRFCYPELRVVYRGDSEAGLPGRSFARLSTPGRYVTTVTRPAMFADYLAEQIDLLVADYGVSVEAGLSAQQIPFPYVLDGLDMSALGGVPPTELARHFPATELSEIGDEIADGLFLSDPGSDRPLPCSTACAPTSRSPASNIIPARRRNMSSASYYLRTITAMSMNSCPGLAPNSSVRMAATSPCPVPAASMSPRRLRIRPG
jgi:hypothetical protein